MTGFTCIVRKPCALCAGNAPDAVSFSHGAKAANSGVYLVDWSRERDRAFNITAVGPADRQKKPPLTDGFMRERVSLNSKERVFESGNHLGSMIL